VWGDSIGAGIVDHLSKKEIEQIEADQAQALRNQDYVSVPQEDLDGKRDANNNQLA
jgi:hypothetical protein